MGRRIHIVSTAIEPPAGEWLDTPFPRFTEGTAGSYDLTVHLRSAGVDRDIKLKVGSLPTGVTLLNDEGEQALVYDGQGPPDTAVGVVLSSESKPIIVDPPPDPNPDFDHAADWLARSRARGVFFATNLTERVLGAKDEVSGYEFVDGFGRVGRQVIPETSETVGIDSNFALYPDGRGVVYLDPSGGPGGLGKQRVFRRVFRWKGLENPDFNLRPTPYQPVNYWGGRDSVHQAPLEPGQPGLRYDLQGNARKYIETERVGTTGNAMPVTRHLYIQFMLKMNRTLLWGRNRNWITHRDTDIYKMAGADPNVWQNKVLFLNGGYSTNQVFVGISNKTGMLSLKGTFGNSFRSFTVARPFLGASSATAAARFPFYYPNIDIGTPPTDSNTPADVMLARYGPNRALMTRQLVDDRPAPLPGAAPFPIDIEDGGQWMTHSEAYSLGIDPAIANSMAAPWRGFPYGGFNWDLKKTYPFLEKQDEVWGGVMEPDQWHVIEILFSEQYDAPVNQDGQIATPTKSPLYPRLVGIWAAPYGKPPTCLGYLGQGDSNPTGAIASHWVSETNGAFDRKNTQLKHQDANEETVRDMGARIVGSETPGCADPTTTVLYMYRSNSARARPEEGGVRTSTKYLDLTGSDASRGQFDWGIKPGCMAGATFGFTSGALTDDLYNPPEMAGYDVSLLKYYQQAVVLSDELVYDGGAIVYVPDPIGGTPRAVHKITLVSPLPIAPAVGDGVNFHASADRLSGEVYNIPGCGEGHFCTSQFIASCDWIPFPGHPNVEPERPWETP